MFGVNEEATSQKIFHEDRFVYKGELWLKMTAVSEIFQIQQANFSRLCKRAARDGQSIRKIPIKTPSRPNKGEYFYNHKDIELASKRKAAELTDRKKRLSSSLSSVRELPEGLSEKSFRILLLLIRDALVGGRMPGLESISERLVINKRTAGYHFQKLVKAGYIERKIFENGKRFEYRFLDGPSDLLRKIGQVNPKLLVPFDWEVDKQRPL